jgi:hypothetical protein
MDDELLEQSESGRADHLKPWQFKPGQSGNPKGRPKGPSLKEWSRAYIESMTDEERLEFMKGIDKKVIWEMAEGKAAQTVDSNVKVEMPQPLLDHVRNNDSDQETPRLEEEN